MRSSTNKDAAGTPKPAARGKTKVVHLLAAPADTDDKGAAPQRVGVQSLGRAFALLEEVARHRESIALADLNRLVGLHSSTTFHLAKLPRRPAVVCACGQRA